MARLVHTLQGKARSTRDVRLRRVLTHRATRCAGTHHACPACKRIQFPTAFPRARARASRRVRFGADAPAAQQRARRRRATRRCH